MEGFEQARKEVFKVLRPFLALLLQTLRRSRGQNRLILGKREFASGLLDWQLKTLLVFRAAFNRSRHFDSLFLLEAQLRSYDDWSQSRLFVTCFSRQFALASRACVDFLVGLLGRVVLGHVFSESLLRDPLALLAGVPGFSRDADGDSSIKNRHCFEGVRSASFLAVQNGQHGLVLVVVRGVEGVTVAELLLKFADVESGQELLQRQRPLFQFAEELLGVGPGLGGAS